MYYIMSEKTDMKSLEILKKRQTKYLPLATKELKEKRKKISHYAWWAFPTQKRGLSEPYQNKTYLTNKTALLLLKSPPKEWKQYLKQVFKIMKEDKKSIRQIFPRNDIGRIDAFITFFCNIIDSQEHKSKWLEEILKHFDKNF